MVFLLFHVFIHTLHTHYYTFLLTVKHQRLFMNIAFDFSHFITLPTFIIISPTLRIMACFTIAISNVRSFTLCSDIVSSFSIRHSSQATLTQLTLLVPVVVLLKLLLT